MGLGVGYDEWRLVWGPRLLPAHAAGGEHGGLGFSDSEVGVRALIIDDSPLMRGLLTSMLNQFGYDTIEVNDGQQALDLLDDGLQVDLCLVDWHMPVMDGPEFVAILRSEPDYDEVRVLMVTRVTDEDKISLALDAGANAYIMKPFTKDALASKLAALGLHATQVAPSSAPPHLSAVSGETTSADTAPPEAPGAAH